MIIGMVAFSMNLIFILKSSVVFRCGTYLCALILQDGDS